MSTRRSRPLKNQPSRDIELTEDGMPLRKAPRSGDPLEGVELLQTRLPKGSAAALVAEDREER
ncbi:MAG: hypothetical protein KAY59_10380 [Acidobacteria bacterium]|nr:hypothetical protein [Acidobacteriota bacterium]